MSRRSFFWGAIPLLCMCAGAGARGIQLESYASRFDSIPIAILKFRVASGSELSANEPWKTIANDLDFSGRFNVLKANSIDSAAFARDSIGIYVDGEYSLAGTSVTLDCYLYDALSRDLYMGKKFTGDLTSLRSMAHRFSNQIIETIFGDKGMFESKIVFVKDNGSKKNLAIMDWDGYGQWQITNVNSVNIFPAFVDSTVVVWTSFIRGHPDIYRASFSGGPLEAFIYTRAIETSPSYSPVNGKIAFASSRDGDLDIYTCNINKSDPRRLTQHKAIDTSPAWSPDGFRIAFTSDRSGSPQIYIMDHTGANVRRLTFEGKYQDSPAWSPKGDKIAYSSLRDGKFDVWVINADGSQPTALTSSAGQNEYPCWSPSASHLAFVSTLGGRSDIYTIRSDGTDLRRITYLGNAKMPDWSHF